jgi:hypothetical protein
LEASSGDGVTIMAKLTMIEAQAAAELAKLLYDFLPGTNARITWPDVAARFCLESFWPGGSKLPAITNLLRNTLEFHRNCFCDFIVAVVQEGMAYRIRKDNPVKRNEIDEINNILLKVEFKIPQLHERKFLDGLPSLGRETAAANNQSQKPVAATEIEKLRSRFLSLYSEPNLQKRGLAFEPFLNDFFSIHGLDPRGSFRILGEQIDGSFEWQGATFLVEARWRNQAANTADLLVLRGKAEKSDWTRGLFISINGFSDLSTPTLQIGRKANLIAMSGQDLILILEQHWTLHEALRAKLRHTGETAEAYKPLSELKK